MQLRKYALKAQVKAACTCGVLLVLQHCQLVSTGVHRALEVSAKFVSVQAKCLRKESTEETSAHGKVDLARNLLTLSPRSELGDEVGWEWATWAGSRRAGGEMYWG